MQLDPDNPNQRGLSEFGRNPQTQREATALAPSMTGGTAALRRGQRDVDHGSPPAVSGAAPPTKEKLLR